LEARAPAIDFASNQIVKDLRTATSDRLKESLPDAGLESRFGDECAWRNHIQKIVVSKNGDLKELLQHRQSKLDSLTLALANY
jgi:hypothetical protein